MKIRDYLKKFLEQNTLLLYLFIISSDAIVLFLADICAFFIRFGEGFHLTVNFLDYLRVAVFIIIFKVLCLYVFQLYTKPKYRSNFILAIHILKATTSSSLVMAIIAYSLRADTIPRLVILLSGILSTVFIFAWRMFYRALISFIIGEDYLKYHLLIIGSDRLAQQAALHRLNNATINYKLVGFIKCNHEEEKSQLLGAPILGSIENIEKISKLYQIDEIFVASPISQRALSKVFSAFKGKKELTFCATPELYDGIISSCRIPETGIPFISSASFQGVSVWYAPLKRILDILISLLLLILALPLMILIALAIKITSPGPIFFLTKRVGFGGKQFIMFKFRSMYEWSSHRRIERWAKKADLRIMPVGRLLRRFKLDELPQLVNVLKNDMSLIGPRPETRYYTNRLLKEIPLYSERLSTKPGITGWAQVNFGYAASIEESKEKLLYDIYYVQNQSLSLDMLIALKTINTVLAGSGVH